MKRLMLVMVLLLPMLAKASFPLEATLAQMVQGADHILTGTVVGVDMIDKDGKILSDPRAMTGPGLKNVIRLHVRVNKVLVTNAASVPPLLKIPLDPFMHYSLGQVKAEEDRTQTPMLLLLKGPSFEPIVAGVFARPLRDQAEALRLRAAKRRVVEAQGRG